MEEEVSCLVAEHKAQKLLMGAEILGNLIEIRLVMWLVGY